MLNWRLCPVDVYVGMITNIRGTTGCNTQTGRRSSPFSRTWQAFLADRFSRMPSVLIRPTFGQQSMYCFNSILEYCSIQQIIFSWSVKHPNQLPVFRSKCEDLLNCDLFLGAETLSSEFIEAKQTLSPHSTVENHIQLHNDYTKITDLNLYVQICNSLFPSE